MRTACQWCRHAAEKHVWGGLTVTPFMAQCVDGSCCCQAYVNDEFTAQQAIQLEALAHRFSYYVLAAPVLTDIDYDALERTALVDAPPDSPLRRPGSDIRSDYPEDVQALAGHLGARRP